MKKYDLTIIFALGVFLGSIAAYFGPSPLSGMLGVWALGMLVYSFCTAMYRIGL
jgi:hypothetical protein